MAAYPKYDTWKVANLAPHVLGVELDYPKVNAMNNQFWEDVRDLFERIDNDHATRVVVLSAAGRMFTAGLDLGTAGQELAGVQPMEGVASAVDLARKALGIRRVGKAWQQSFTNIERCGKPVIACVHNGCIGGGIEMISACDVRFCTEDAYFVMAEVSIGLAADVGGLQRFPKILGSQSLVRELALSGRRMDAKEAFHHGFVSRILDDKGKMMEAAVELAKAIAAKSPVATLGVKHFLNYTRDHSVDESLDYAITWNMGMLQGEDMKIAAMSMMQKKTPVFPDLPQVEAKSKL